MPTGAPAFLLAASLLVLAPPSDNAANDYLAAVKSFKEPNKELSELESWGKAVRPPQALARILRENASALESIRAGSQAPRCEFKPDAKAPASGPDVPSLLLLKLGRLLILDGRLAQSAGTLEAAIADFKAALGLAGHLGHIPSALPRAVGATLEKHLDTAIAAPGLGRKSPKGFCGALDDSLAAYLKLRLPAVDLVEVERKQALSSGKAIAGALGKQPKIAAAYERELAARVDAYFDSFAHYAIAPTAESSKAIDEATRRIEEEPKLKYQRFEALSGALAGLDPDPAFRAEVEKWELVEELPAALASFTMQVLSVDLRQAIDTNAEGRAALDRLKTRLADCR